MNSRVKCSFDEQGILSVIDQCGEKCWSCAYPLNVSYFNRKDSSLHKLSSEQSDCQHKRLVETKKKVVFEYNFTESGLIFNVEYTWSKTRFEVNIPIDKIQETKNDFRLAAIEPMPLWGAVAGGESGYMFLPIDSGTICRFDKDERFESHFLLFGRSKSTTMPVFGMVHDFSAFLGIVTSGEFDTKLVVKAGADTNCVYVAFCYREAQNDEMDRIDRTVSFRFLTGEAANYSGMATAYREYLLNERKIKPLRERIKDNPMLDYYRQAYNDIRIDLGIKKFAGPGVEHDGKGHFMPNLSFAEAETIVDLVHDCGIEKATFILVGWSHDGHDGLYPTKLPPDERLGGEKGIRKLLDHSRALGYQIVCHDNYTDAYQLSTDWNSKHIQKNRDGSLVTPKWYWSGGLGYKICPEAGLKLAEKNYPQIRAMGFEGVWVNDAMPLGLFNCFDSEHKHLPVRRSVAEGYCKIAAFTRETFGGCHVENAMDFMADSIDAISSVKIQGTEPLEEPARTFHQYFGSEFVPFYQITYHGLIVYHFKQATSEGLLREIELGAMPRFEVEFELAGNCIQNLKENLSLMKKQYDTLCEEFKDLQLLYIENHRQLADGVFETEYENGTRVVVNHTALDYRIENTTVKAGSYVKIPLS